MPSGNGWLVTAGSLSIVAALLHFGCIIGGGPWFRALGAGEPIARAAERGVMMPNILALLIGTVLLGWAAYAFSAARLIISLPLTRSALVAICAVLLLRGLGVPLMQAWRSDLSPGFIYATAAICTALGIIFLIGTLKAWPDLAAKGSF